MPKGIPTNKIMLGSLLVYHIVFEGKNGQRTRVIDFCLSSFFFHSFIYLTESRVSRGDECGVGGQQQVGQFIEQTDKPRQTGDRP